MADIKFTEKDKKIIQIFKSTYNARYLRDFQGTVLIKKYKIKKLYEHLKRARKNTVLVNLISNLIKYNFAPGRQNKIIKPPYNLENIEGPYFLKKMRLEEVGKDQELSVVKTVYIYGEQHRKEVDITGSCPAPSTRFNEYLNLLREMSPAFIDIYIEEAFSKAKHPIYSNEIIINESYKNIINKIRTGTKFSQIKLSEEFRNKQQQFLKVLAKVPYNADLSDIYSSNSFMIEKIGKDLSQCIAPQYDRSYCKIIRVHSIDMRYSVSNDTVADVIPKDYTTVLLCIRFIPEYLKIEGIYNFIKLIDNQFTVVDEDGDDVSLLENLIDIMKTNPEGLIEAFRTSTKIQRQYELSYEKERITNFFIQKCRLKSSDIILLGTILEKFLIADTIVSLPTKDETILLYNLLVDIRAMIMDYYGLLRIFKEYLPREKKLPTDPEPLDHPIRSTNIIIYTGAKHSEIYYEFFESIGFKTFFSYVNPIVYANPRIPSIQSHCVNTKKQFPEPPQPEPPQPEPPLKKRKNKF